VSDADPAKVPARAGRKPKGEGHSRRAEILEAAERIFVEHGYEGATIRKIAEEVGLSSTALYIHFPDKGAILHEICRSAFEALSARMRAIADEGLSPEARLEGMLEAYVDFGFANPNAYRLAYLTRPAEAREGAETAAQALGAELFREFSDAVEALAAERRLRVEIQVAAQVLWAGAHGIVSLMITKPYFPWAQREAVVTAMRGALMTGLVRG